MELTLEVLVDLAGPLKDGKRSSKKLREKLQETASLPDLEELLNESLQGTDTHHNRALQDIVNNIGQRLAFDVDYGNYQPSTKSPSYDGLWVSEDMDSETVHLVVETKKSTNYTIDPEHQPGSYMDRLVETEDISEDRVYGLIVVGDDRKLHTVVQSVRGSAYRNRVRVITCDQLFELLSMAQESDLNHSQVTQVLLPMDTVNAGSLVDLMNRIVNRSPSPSSKKTVDSEGSSAEQTFWGRCAEEANAHIQEDGTVVLSESANNAKSLREVVDIAFDLGHITASDLPYSAGGRTRYLINTEPVHQEGKEMKVGKEIREGIWVECNRSKDVIERCIQRLGEDFVA